MQDITDQVRELAEFDNHQQVLRIENEELGVVGFIAIHSLRGNFPSLGATRVWYYQTEEEALKDSLRLSRLMSHKSVFADLPYGGAKAVLKVSADNTRRNEIFAWYAGILNELGGRFVTGSDVGIVDEELGLMREHSRFVIGDGVPASYYTALGVFSGIEVALKNNYGTSDLSRRSFAIEGVGKTGLELLKLLEGKGGQIIISDIEPERAQKIFNEYPSITVVKPQHIYAQKVDVFCPCALSHSINSVTEQLLRCSAIVGSANNQMEDPAVEQYVFRRGILYAVDYAVNNGGLISVVDQYENGTHDDNRIKLKLLHAKDKLQNTFEESRLESIVPSKAADRYVDSVLKVKYSL